MLARWLVAENESKKLDDHETSHRPSDNQSQCVWDVYGKQDCEWYGK